MNKEINHLEDQRKKAEKQLEQNERKLQKSIYYENRKKRKERTRNLIQKGALLDKYFETDILSVEETEELLNMFSEYVNSKKIEKFKKKEK